MVSKQRSREALKDYPPSRIPFSFPTLSAKDQERGDLRSWGGGAGSGTCCCRKSQAPVMELDGRRVLEAVAEPTVRRLKVFVRDPLAIHGGESVVCPANASGIGLAVKSFPRSIGANP